MIFVKDAKELKFVRFNKAGETLLGIPRADMIGKNDFDFFPREQAEAFTANDREALNGKKLIDIREEPINTPNGPRILHTKKIPILDKKGEPLYLLGISEDITETKSLQIKLLQAKKMEAVGVLAGGVAHEFNNILTGIMFSTGFINRTLTPDDDKRVFTEEIFEACRRAGSLTRQLLAFSQQESAPPTRFDCNKVVLDSKEALQAMLKTQVHLTIKPSPTPAFVNLDLAAFQQSLLSLANNAREAMPNGGEFKIVIKPVNFETAPPCDSGEPKAGDYISISVSDTGRGMNAETKAHLFEPFFTTKGRSNGTGLELASLLGLVKSAGGFISVTSEPEQGSRFDLFLPERKIPAATPSKHGPTTKTTAHPKVVMVVEDEAVLRKAAQRILQNDGYTVISAGSGEEALQLLRDGNRNVDLLLTDVIMPGMGGVTLAEHMKAENPRTKIMFMSGYADSDLPQKYKIFHDSPLLMKPIAPEDLLEKIARVLSPPATSFN